MNEVSENLHYAELRLKIFKLSFLFAVHTFISSLISGRLCIMMLLAFRRFLTDDTSGLTF